MHLILQKFPWVSALPEDAQAEFAAELAETSRAEQPALVSAWQATAEVYADPDLHAALAASTEGDFEPVLPPA